MTYKETIGLEIHIELGTKSKMFCGCAADHFQVAPNSHTCPVCLGLPGALPVPNKQAVEWTLLLGLALNCKIAGKSKFDRKHYNYPDLPKGYQISQYDQPLCEDGYLETSKGKVRIRRVHIEEDTGKLVHQKLDGKEVSLVDFNRSGVPLVEIVTEPDLIDGAHASEFAQKVQEIVRALGISSADMEKGSMRIEANTSLGLDLGYKVEVKNLNSFKFVQKAVDYELARQKTVLAKGDTPAQETRGWDEGKQVTVPQRYKETAADYRYFPEPDIPPMEFANEAVENLRKQLPKSPTEIKEELADMGIRPDYVSRMYTSAPTVSLLRGLSKIAPRTEMNKLSGVIVNSNYINYEEVTPENFLADYRSKLNSAISSTDSLQKFVKEVLAENPKMVADYKSGKQSAIGALMGQVMAKSGGKADPKITMELLRKALK